MMKSADLRYGHDLAGLRWLDLARARCVTIERLVRPRRMVVIQITGKQPLQMRLIEHNHMIEQLAADRADEPFDVGVLPERAWGADNLFDAQVFDSPLERLAVNTVAITHQKPRGRIERECFDDLLRRPLGRRVRRHVEMHSAATVETQHHETVQKPECSRRHDKEIDGGGFREMVRQKRLPGGRRWFAATVDVPRDGRFGQFVAQFRNSA